MGIDVPRFPFTFVLRHLDPSHDAIARDLGYASWAEMLRIVVRLEEPLTTFASPETVPHGNKLSVIFTRSGEDVATIGMHFLHRDGPEVVPFTGDDMTAIETHFGSVWVALRDFYDPTLALAEFRWHQWGVGVRKPNPAVRDFVLAEPDVGTNEGSEPLPAQCAVSVTFKTSVRRNWGRVYCPAIAESAVVDGRLLAAHCDTFRTAFGTFADSCADDSTPLVVWCPRRLNGPLRYDKPGTGTTHHDAGDDNPDDTSFARTVDQVQVDDVIDVIRSRRLDKAVTRSTHTIA